MKSFQLYGKEIKRSTEQDNYNQVRVMYYKIAKERTDSFRKKFYEQFSNIDAVVERVPEYGRAAIIQAINQGIAYLNQQKIFSVDQDRFLSDNDDCFEAFYDACEEVTDQYYEIIMTKEEASEYRRQRKDARGRVVGGGFGVSGALQGMAMAGTLNMASGLAHSAVNAVGNLASSIDASIKKKDLYKNPNVLNLLAEGLYNSLYMIHYSIGEILVNQGFHMSCPTTEEENEARAIFHNIVAGNVPANMVQEQLVHVVECNPYEYDVYEYMVQKFGDALGEVSALSTYFGLSIDEYKITEVEKIIVECDFTNATKVEATKELTKSTCERNGVVAKPYLDAIDKILSYFDTYDRTVDGEIYEDTQAADRIKSQINAWGIQLEKSDLSEDEIMSVIEEMKTSQCKSLQKYVNYLNDIVKEYDVYYRTTKGIEFVSRDLANQAREENRLLSEYFQKLNLQGLSQIAEAKVEVSGYATKIKEIYLDVLNQVHELRTKQFAFMNQNASLCFSSRMEATQVYLDAQMLREVDKKIGFVSESYASYFEGFENQILNVYTTRYPDITSANKAYIKMVKHAVSYLEYMNEKNGPKKGFFSSLKNNVSGLVVKNYEGEYNFLTQNGQYVIPDQAMQDDSKLLSVYENKRKECNDYLSVISQINEKLQLPARGVKPKVNFRSLIEITKTVEARDLNHILNDVLQYKSSKIEKDYKKEWIKFSTNTQNPEIIRNEVDVDESLQEKLQSFHLDGVAKFSNGDDTLMNRFLTKYPMYKSNGEQGLVYISNFPNDIMITNRGVMWVIKMDKNEYHAHPGFSTMGNLRAEAGKYNTIVEEKEVNVLGKMTSVIESKYDVETLNKIIDLINYLKQQADL